MAISLKEQIKQVKEITYHAPVFNKDYYEDSDLHGAGQRSGTRMFYDFYAIENLWSWVGSGSRPKAERQHQKFAADDDPTKNIVGTHISAPRFILPASQVKVIDDVFEQVTRAVSKHLVNYVHLAVVQEFQYLLSQSPGWSKFRQAIVAIYNKAGTMSKVEFQRLVAKYLPDLKEYPDTVKRLLKYSKYYSEMHTKDDKDPYDVTRAYSGSPKPEPEEPVAELPPEPDPTPEPMPGLGEPDTTDYEAPQIEDPFHDPDDEPSGGVTGTDPTYSDEDDYWKKKKLQEQIMLLREEKINPSKIKKVYASMQKAGVTLDDVEKAYNNIEWGGAYGGPRWGQGAIAMLKLMKARKTEDPEDLAHIIDHIYDLQHNTGSLLNKGPMYVSDEDLNRRFRVTHISRFLPFVSPMIKMIILRYLKYVHGNSELESQKEEIINKPAEQLTPEEQQALSTEGFTPKGHLFRININFVNKKKEQVSGVYYEFGKHAGKYCVNDNFRADVQVYDTFQEAFNYVMGHKQDFLKSGYSMSSTPAVQSEKDNYVQSHTKTKLATDRELQLLDVCKMGWRAKPDSQYYKAYFSGNKRFQTYAFSDGSYLCTFNDTEAYKIFTDWDNAFNYCKSATDNALPYPDYDNAKAMMGMGGVAAPATAPAASPKEYYLEPLEQSTLATLVSAELPQFEKKEYKLANMLNGMIVVVYNNYDKATSCFTVGKKMNSTFGKPYKLIHYIGAGGMEDFSFKDWNNTLDFITKNIEVLVVPKSVASQLVHPTSHTPTIYGQVQLPANATGKGAYSAHVGINTPPKHSIRLTVEDEEAMKSMGFMPKLVGMDVWYIHKTANDTVKFYPNNEAKILFTGKTKSPVVKKTIPDMLAWLPQYYTDLTKQSPLVSPAASITTTQAGSKAGSMFEATITAAGFQWDDSTKKYVDGENTLVINPYPKSTVTVGGEQRTFANLPALASFLKNEYQSLKKKVAGSKPVITDKAKKLIDLLVKGQFKKTDEKPATTKGGVKYVNPVGDIVILYGDHSSDIYDSGHNNNEHFENLDQLLEYMSEMYGHFASPTPNENITKQEFGAIKMIVSKYPKYTLDYVPANDPQHPNPAFKTDHVQIYQNGVFFLSVGKPDEWRYQITDSQHKVLADHQSFNNMLIDLDGLLITEGSEHNGITQAEFMQIKEIAGKYGYISSWFSDQEQKGQSAYVAIYKKPADETIPAKYPLVYTIGALGNYYQINTADGKPYKNFSNFHALKSVLDAMLGGDGGQGVKNLKNPPPTSPTPINELNDEEFKLIKDLVTQYPNMSVKRKKLTSNVMGETPYVGIEYKKPKQPKHDVWTIGKTANNGEYVLYRVIGHTWDQILQTPSWESIYDKLTLALSAYNQGGVLSLTQDQKEWIETYVTNRAPHLTTKQWDDGTVGVYDEHNKKNPADKYEAGNPLFICSKQKSTAFTVRWFVEDHGASYSYHTEDTFEAMADWIKDNFEEITKLAKPPVPEGSYNVESELINALFDGGFEYKGTTQDPAGDCNVYDNPQGSRIKLYDSGIVGVYHNNQKFGFNTHIDLIDWLKKTFGDQEDLPNLTKLNNLLKELNYHDIGNPPGEDHCEAWENQWDDTIFVYDDDNDVVVQPMWGNEEQHAMSFHLGHAEAIEYLKQKHINKTMQMETIQSLLDKAGFVLANDSYIKADSNVSKAYVHSVKHDMAFFLKDGSGVFKTAAGNSPQVNSSFHDIMDLAYYLNEYYGENAGKKPENWSPNSGTTGDTELDEMLKDAEFEFQGASPGDILAMNFKTPGGATIKIFDDGSSNHKWAPKDSNFPEANQSIGWNDYPSLKEFLKNTYASKPTDGFPGNAALEKDWGDLWNKLQDYGFVIAGKKVVLKSPDPVKKKKKIVTYKHPNGVEFIANSDGVCTYLLPKGNPPIPLTTFKVAEAYLDKIYGKKDKLPKSYYDDLGESQQAYTIPLAEDDDFQMKMLGWVFVSAGESQTPSAYVHKDTGKKIVFYNKSIMPNKPTAQKFDKDGSGLLDFKDEQIYQVIEFLKKHPEKMSDKKPAGGNFSEDYSTNVGPDPNHQTIRLKKEHDQILEDYGFTWLPLQGSMPFIYKHCISGDTLAFYNPSQQGAAAPQAAKLLTPDGSSAKKIFGSIPEALAWVKGNNQLVIGGPYSNAYYTIVGPQPKAATIRLKFNDEKVMLKAGYKWVPGWISGNPSSYTNIVANTKMEFYNKAINKMGPAANFMTYAGEIKKSFSDVQSALDFIFSYNPKTDKQDGSKSLLTKEEATPIMVNELTLQNWNPPPHSYDDVVFVFTDPNNPLLEGGGEIQVQHIQKVKFAIGKMPCTMTDEGVMWYVRHVNSNGEKIYSFLKRLPMLSFIQNHLEYLLTFKPIPSFNDDDKKSKEMIGPAYHLTTYMSGMAYGVGFHEELNSLGVRYDHESKFWFQAFQNGIAWHCEKGSKEWFLPKDMHEDYLKKVFLQLSPQMNDDEIDIIFSAETVSRREKVFDRILRICRRLNGIHLGGTYFDESMEATGFSYNEFDKCYVNEEIYQAVVVMPGFGGNKYRIYWVNKSGQISHGQTNSDKVLAATIGPKGSLVKNGFTGELEMQYGGQQAPAFDQFVPSGETYKTHSEEPSASLINLNKHDEKILQKAGFQWVPKENQYYKHAKTGDIAKFTDTGKAEVTDVALSDNMEFDSITHALRYIVLKYIQSPWTNQNYNTNPTDDNLDNIKLNDHDTSILKTLGYEFDEKKEIYIKEIDPGSTPALEENSEDPRYEVITAYNSGNAIWEDTSDTNPISADPYETKEGTIIEILNFVWNRWKDDIESIAGVEKGKKTSSESPLSDHNYNTIKEDGVQKVVELVPKDAEALMKVGFTFTEQFGYPLYVRGEDENFAAYNDDTAHYTGKLATQQQGDINFKSVKEGLQLLLKSAIPENKSLIVPSEEITDKLEKLGFIVNDKGYYVQADIDPNKQVVAFYSDGMITYGYVDHEGKGHGYNHTDFSALYPYIETFIDDQNHLVFKPVAFVYGKRAPEITHKVLTSTMAFRWDDQVKAYVKNWDSEKKWEAIVYGYDGDKYVYYRPDQLVGMTYHKPFKSTNPQAIINAAKGYSHMKSVSDLQEIGFPQLKSPITPVVGTNPIHTEFYKTATKEALLVTSNGETYYGTYGPMAGTGQTVFAPHKKYHSLEDVIKEFTAGLGGSTVKESAYKTYMAEYVL